MRKASPSFESIGKLLKKYAPLLKQQIKDPLHRNSLYLIASSVVTSVLGFVFWIVVARFYDESAVGYGAATISAIVLIATFSKLGLGTAIIRFISKEDRPVELINACLTLCGLVSLAVSAIFIAGVDVWSPALSFITGDVRFIVAFVVFALFSTLSGMMEQVFIAIRRADFILLRSSIFCLLRIALPFIMVISFHAFGIVSSWGIAIGITLSVSLFFLLPRGLGVYKPMPRLKLDRIKKIWRYSAGNYLANLFGQTPDLVLPILIVNIYHLGAQQAAYFYIAWRIAYFLFMIPSATSRSLFAEGSHFEDKLAANVLRSHKFTLLILVPGVILVLALGKWLLLIFGASYSINGLTLLQILAVSSIPLAVNHIYFSIIKVQNRIRELVVLRGFIAVATLLGTYLVTKATGSLLGVGYVWLGAQVLVSIYVLFSMKTRTMDGLT
jgi:O-antigen/teichoic acid export membrane protein